MWAVKISEGVEKLSDKIILNRMMQGAVQISEVYRYIDSDLLGDMLYKEYKPVHSAIYDYYSRHKRPPSFIILRKILDDLFYPEFDKLSGIDLPTNAEVTA